MGRCENRLPFLADFVANQGTCSGAADGAQCAAKDGVADHTAGHCAYASTDLRIGRIGAAASHG